MSDDENYFTATRLPYDSIRILARAVDPETGTVGRINRVVSPGEDDYQRFAAIAADARDD